MKAFALSLGVLCLVALSVVAAMQLLPAEPHSAARAESACIGYVREKLRAPATAVFPERARQTLHYGDGRYVVRSHVDSQNAYGALIRSEYDCAVQWARDDVYALESVNIAAP